MRITRTYHRNGLIKTERQQIRTLTGTNFSTHDFTLTYTYDGNGRRNQLQHPANLAPV